MGSGEVELQRYCPNCGKERPPTGGAFCNYACEYHWHTDTNYYDMRGREPEPVVEHFLGETNG